LDDNLGFFVKLPWILNKEPYVPLYMVLLLLSYWILMKKLLIFIGLSPFLCPHLLYFHKILVCIYLNHNTILNI